MYHFSSASSGAKTYLGLYGTSKHFNNSRYSSLNVLYDMYPVKFVLRVLDTVESDLDIALLPDKSGFKTGAKTAQTLRQIPNLLCDDIG